MDVTTKRCKHKTEGGRGVSKSVENSAAILNSPGMEGKYVTVLICACILPHHDSIVLFFVMEAFT